MKPQPSNGPQPAPSGDPEQWLSAMADGDCDERTLDAVCQAWKVDAEARRVWHAYHLIGDVMRSEDLATDPGRDAAFLAGVRARLAAEPVLFAPAPQRRRYRPWLVPAAMAAGFFVVAGVLVLVRNVQPVGVPHAAELAAASSAAAVPAMVVVGGSVARPAPARSFVEDSGMLRDARLDEFLRAHQAVGPGTTMAVPGGTLRRVDIVDPAAVGR
jgi:sigma-E factor negative regulatory protein RseA